MSFIYSLLIISKIDLYEAAFFNFSLSLLLIVFVLFVIALWSSYSQRFNACEKPRITRNDS